jgi:MFS transporter, NNP family, nitrate/nitrite transporter
VAQPLAHAYGVSLAIIGLLTTALFLMHLAAQIPAGMATDRLGPKRVALIAIGSSLAGNVLLVLVPSLALAVPGRMIVGVGSGAGFLAGFELVRSGGGGPLAQGFYGASTMAGGGIALMTLPGLTDATSWRAPYVSAIALTLLAALAVSTVPATAPIHGSQGTSSLRAMFHDHDLLPLGVLASATFGLSLVAGNWIVTLLERQGASPTLAGLTGGLILFAGITTRPTGGALVRRSARIGRLVAVSLVAGAGACAALAAGVSLAVSALAALVLGLAAGLPFAAIFAATARLRPDAPAAAFGFVNGCAVLTILVGTPLAGLTFSLPGDGRIAFGVMSTLWAASLLALRRAKAHLTPRG